MSVFENARFNSHESVHFFNDPDAGLKAIISVHSTRRGPAAGGTRFWRYENEQDAISDALNLSRAMSYKNAMADIPFGGGKAVIMRPDGEFNRRQLFSAYGRAVNALGGRYCTAEDVGVGPEDMKAVREQTPYVAGLTEGVAASGDPSPVTADGVFRGLHVAIENTLGTTSMQGVRVAVQGLGHVGYHLCRMLSEAGAKLYVADINEAVTAQAHDEFDAIIVNPEDIHAQDVDIFAPCALGGAINPKTIEELKAKIVGGAANNQLISPEMGEALQSRGILYCPDYVINGGGIINVAAELSGSYDPEWVDGRVEGLKSTLSAIFKQSKLKNLPTNVIADQMAEDRIYGKELSKAG